MNSNTKIDPTYRLGVWVLAGISLLLFNLAATAQLAFSNPATITINDNTVASPFPSTITTSGLSGQITRLSVTLNGVTHSYPSDIEVLLVGPSGASVVLMASDGGSTPINKLNLTFSDSATNVFVVNQAISGSGVFQPSNLNTAMSKSAPSFPSPAPAPPYGAAFSSFTGSTPNGVWKLYVLDDFVGNSGSIATGWTLNIDTTPVITGLSTVSLNENVAASIPFNIADSDPNKLNSGNLTITFTSGDTTLVSNTNMSVSGSNGSYTFNVTPNLNRANSTNSTSGTVSGVGTNATPITISVKDNVTGVTTSGTFGLSVLFVNNKPTFGTSVPNQAITAGAISTNVPYVINDIETAPNLLTVSASSSNPSVIPSTNVFFGPLNANGTNSLIVAPLGVATGTAVITLQVVDQNLGTNTTSFTVNVTGPTNHAPQFANVTNLNIIGQTVTSSTIAVSGVPSTAGKVIVKLADLNHPTGDLVSALLVGPAGQTVLLMGNPGDTSPLVHRELTFDGLLGAALPNGTPLTNGTYIPANLFGTPSTFTMPPPAPTAPGGGYLTSLSTFNQLDPNGTWTLYLYDDLSSFGTTVGNLGGGWSLTFLPTPYSGFGAIGTQSVQENGLVSGATSISVHLDLGDVVDSVNNVTFVAHSSNQTIVPDANISVVGTGGSRNVVVVPAQNQNTAITGPISITVTGTDTVTGVAGPVSGFSLLVNAVNQAPIIAFVPKQTTTGGDPLTIPIIISDVEEAVQPLTVTIGSSNDKLIPNATLSYGKLLNFGRVYPAVYNDALTVFPAASQSGTSTITVTVNDGGASNNITTITFDVVVPGQANPTYANTVGLNIPSNGGASTYPSTITVSGVAGKISDFSATLYDISHKVPKGVDALLVGPNGKGVILMADAGGSSPIADLVLVFEDDGGVLSNAGPLSSGIFHSADYTGVNSDPSPSWPGAPAGPYIGSMAAAFNGISPNGVWSLYVTNLSAQSGSIAGGWSISLDTAPVVTFATNAYTTKQNSPLVVKFTIGDDQTLANNWTVTATSSNPALVPNNSTALALSGTLGSRTLTLTPANNANTPNNGTSTITVTATDGFANSSTSTFTLTVSFVDQPPTISSIANIVTDAGFASSVIPFTVGDIDTPVGSLTVTAVSDNPSLIPNDPVNNIILGGSGASRTIQLIPSIIQSGSAKITVTVADAVNKVSTSFTNTVLSGINSAFANTNVIIINDNAIASPYPSQIAVSGVAGTLIDTVVTLNGVTHQFPEDIEVLLVGPKGQKAVLMADAGGKYAISNVRLQFDPLSSTALPFGNGGGTLTSGDYLPSNYSGTPGTSSPYPPVSPDPAATSFPSPAPAGPYTATFAPFNGTDPNGIWSLYVIDHTAPDSGYITNGWSLIIETAPAITSIPATVSMIENQPISVPFTIGSANTALSNLTVSVTSGSLALVPSANIAVSVPGVGTLANGASLTNLAAGSANALLSITNAANQFGTNGGFSVVVTDTVLGGVTTSSFTLGVAFSNQPPVITLATNRVISTQNVSSIPATVNTAVLNFGVTNPEISDTVTPSLSPATSPLIGKAVFAGAGGAQTLTLTPATNQFGTNIYSVVVSDGVNAAVSKTFTLEVPFLNNPPTLTANNFTFGAVSNVTAGTASSTWQFTVGDVETAAKSLTIVATSSNPSVIPNSNIILINESDSTKHDFVVYPSFVASGTADVNIFVTDGNGATVSNKLTINIVAPSASVFSNTNNPITITGSAKASPYPSTITVSGLSGTVGNASVTLVGFTHPLPDNVDILLVSPSGKAVTLMADAGGSFAINNARLTFDDSGHSLPFAAQIVSTNILQPYITYKPSDFTANDNETVSFPSPAPSGPYSATLSALTGTAPNGVWSLYIVDNSAASVTGVISGGWILNLAPAPTITGLPGTAATTAENTTSIAIPFAVASQNTSAANLTVSGHSSNQALINDTNLVFSGAGGVRSLTYKGQPNVFGSNTTVTVTVTDPTINGTGNATASATFTANISFVNQPPVITRLDDQTILQNQTLVLPFNVTDVDDTLTAANIFAGSSDATLVKNDNTNSLVISGSGTNYTLTLRPVANAAGALQITVFATNNGVNLIGAGAVSNTFNLTINTVNQTPTISLPGGTSYTTTGGKALAVPFTVGDLETPTTLTVTATTTDAGGSPSTIIPSVSISGVPGSTSGTATMTPVAGLVGPVTVTLTVKDPVTPFPTSKVTFTVAVRPSTDRIFANTNVITIKDNQASVPYPSTNLVSGLYGNINSLTATVTGFKHSFPQDVDALLVGPQGQKVLLFGHVGNGFNITNVGGVTLTFDDSAASGLSSATSISSGTYKPTDGKTGPGAVGYTFPLPAPSGPYPVNFSAFGNTNPNGTWSLYVQDEAPGDDGYITNGWSLDIQTRPAFGALPSGTNSLPESTTVKIPFTVGDDTSSNLTFTITSDVPSLIPVNIANLSVGAPNSSVVVTTNGGVLTWSVAGTNAILTVTPALYQFGTNTLRITVTDEDLRTQTAALPFNVQFVNNPPTISAIPAQTTTVEVPTAAVAFTIGDNDPAAAGQTLTVTAASSDPTLIPSSNIILGGSGANRTIMVVPAGTIGGTASVSVSVSDGLTSATSKFLVTVLPSTNPVFDNGGAAITINDLAKATPYPSTISVSGVVGNITGVTVTLNGISHAFPNDVDILLVGPTGSNAVVLAHTGGILPATAWLTISDSASSSLGTGNNLSSSWVSGTFKPTIGSGSFTFASPAPAAPYGVGMAAFNGTNPNGTWSLYVQDDTLNSSGTIQGGWAISFQTAAPTVSGLPATVTTAENTPVAVPFTVADGGVALSALTFSAISSNPQVVPTAGVVFSGSGANRTVTITPGLNQPGAPGFGSSTVGIIVSDGVVTITNNVVVNVTFVDQPPTLSSIPNVIINENTSINIPFTAGDAETGALGALTFSVQSTNTTLLPTGNVVVTGAGTSYTLAVTPAANQFGKSQVTLVVTDGGGLSATNVFQVSVAFVNIAPTVTPIANISINEYSSAQVLIGVTDPDTALTNLTFTVVSSNPTLIPAGNVSIALQGTNFVATVTPASGQFGVAALTITVSDGVNNVSTSFGVQVNFVDLPPAITGLVASTNVAENGTVTIPFNVADADDTAANLFVSVSSSDTSLVPASGLVLTGAGTASQTLKITPALNKSGTNVITITVSDSVSTVSNQVALTVNFVDQPPTIAGLPGSVSTGQNTAVTVPFTIADVDTPIASLITVANSSNTTLVPNSGLVVTGTGANRTLTITPAANQLGTANITLGVYDGVNLTTSIIPLTVNFVPTAPTISAIATVSIFENTSATVNFTVGSSTKPATALTVSASSSNTSLVPNAGANLALNGTGTTNQSLVITPLANQFGATLISLVVSDGTLSATNSFTLNVLFTNTLPTISQVLPVTIKQGASVVLPVTVGDKETAAGSLTLSASSSNPALVSAANVVFGGSGANRTVAITPVPSQNGSATITLTVTDGNNGTASTSFVLSVTAAPPVITGGSTGGGGTTGGNFTLGFNATPGITIIIQSSTDLKSWIPVSTNTVPASGVVSFIDTATKSTPGKFFRVLFP